MATYTTNDLRSGMKLMIDGAPWTVVDVDFVKPGKGQAFARVKMRNLQTRRVVEKTFKSGESMESEQVAAGKDAVGDAAQWLKEQDMCTVTLWNNEPIEVVPPNFVELEIVETDPGIRGDTASGGTKPATLETGAVVKVPLFVEQNEKIKVDTRTGDYVSRATK